MSTDPGHAVSVATDMVAMLAVEPLGGNVFRAVSTIDTQARGTIFGGQVVGQALRAAGLTVPDGRQAHSLHAYFLLTGDPTRPVDYHVTLTRDGRSFSTRHVTAEQGDTVIFEMLSSFHTGQPGADLDRVKGRRVQSPDGLPTRKLERLPETIVEVREITSTDFDAAEPIFSDCMWVRSAVPLPDDPLVHACALAYISDLGSGFGHLFHEGIERAGSSLDHSIWFHAPLRVDDWVLLDLSPVKAHHARGVYHGSLRDTNGTLGATVAQETLLRLRR